VISSAVPPVRTEMSGCALRPALKNALKNALGGTGRALANRGLTVPRTGRADRD